MAYEWSDGRELTEYLNGRQRQNHYNIETKWVFSDECGKVDRWLDGSLAAFHFRIRKHAIVCKQR